MDLAPPDYFLYGGSFETLQFMSELEEKFDHTEYGHRHRHGCHRGKASHHHPNPIDGDHDEFAQPEFNRELPTHHRGPIYEDNDSIPPENHRELPTHHRGPIFDDNNPIPPENHRELPTHNRGPIYDDDESVPPENYRKLPTHNRYHPHHHGHEKMHGKMHGKMHQETNGTDRNTVSKTSSFTFLPTEHSSIDISLDGRFSKGAGQVNIRQSTEPAQEHTIVNITILSTGEERLDSIQIAKIPHWNTFIATVKPANQNQYSGCSRKYEFVSYKIDIVFPSTLRHFDTVKLQLRQVDSIKVQKMGFIFEEFSVGVARGDIALDNKLTAHHIRLGALHGDIVGTFNPVTSIIAAAVRGSTDIRLIPGGNSVDIVAVAVHGSSTVLLSKDRFEGYFEVEQATPRGTNLVYGTEMLDFNYLDYTPNRAVGFYKHGFQSKVLVRSQHGKASLHFF
ncbi:hypothetical protein DFQ30_004420 [Apophysomyces sp. BC1015]|nr:hypothetical protein DFQ30_004420 [Apophysomyces sp. BC1015]